MRGSGGRVILLGGPGSRLPRCIESSLSWALCVSCLSVPYYHWCISDVLPRVWSCTLSLMPPFLQSYFLQRRKAILSGDDHNDNENDNDNDNEKKQAERKVLQFLESPFVALTTASRREQAKHTAKERHDELVQYLHHLHGSLCVLPSPWQDLSEEEFIHVFRNNDICRRLASLMMRPYYPDRRGSDSSQTWFSKDSTKGMTCLLKHYPDLQLPKRLARVWPQLLALPPPGTYAPKPNHDHDHDPPSQDVTSTTTTTTAFPYKITVVIPAFREDGRIISSKLTNALTSCHHPHQVQLLLLDAGQCQNLHLAFQQQPLLQHSPQNPPTTNLKHWGKATIVPYTHGGGRGCCLNYGAKLAQGQILTFLHSDTKLPEGWDDKVVQTLLRPNTAPTTNECCGGGAGSVDDDDGGDGTTTQRARPNSCAFGFGIDTTEEACTTTEEGTPPPPLPGIRAVEQTVKWRTHWFHLPYGDQVLSIPTTIFRHVGGFPDQCLMEDYELVSLLRQRAAAATTCNAHAVYYNLAEWLAVIRGPPALCSPRRWRMCGVLYVTFMNSKLVYLYARGMSPEELFLRYYGRGPPERGDGERSPWEVELALALGKEKE